MDNSEKWLDEQLPGIYGELPEIIRNVFSLMPFGQQFTLANGRIGKITKFVAPRIRDERWEFGFDVRFDKGSPDHIEFFVKHTGGGGMINEPVLPSSPIGTA